MIFFESLTGRIFTASFIDPIQGTPKLEATQPGAGRSQEVHRVGVPLSPEGAPYHQPWNTGSQLAGVKLTVNLIFAWRLLNGVAGK